MSFKINSEFKLSGSKVKFLSTTGKDSGEFNTGLPDTIVIHYTAGSSLDSSVKTLQDPAVKASAHLIVGRDGAVRQLVPFNKIAWHAGQSSYLDRDGLNQYSIGIELDNAGKLEKTGDVYTSWFGKQFPEKEVLKYVPDDRSDPTYWQVYSEKQIAVTFELCKALSDYFEIEYILGHEEIAPGRKIDPGPAFPIGKLRNILLENRALDRPEPEIRLKSTGEALKAVVTADRLNFRAAPSVKSGLLQEPLKKGTVLDIVEEDQEWIKVNLVRSGWVKKEFVRKI